MQPAMVSRVHFILHRLARGTSLLLNDEILCRLRCCSFDLRHKVRRVLYGTDARGSHASVNKASERLYLAFSQVQNDAHRSVHA